MACINMFNSEHQGGLRGAPPPMSPRISFSNDFAADPSSAPAAAKHAAPADPNFEFSVGTRPMMAADELFFKGRMLPLRGDGGSCSTARLTTTLRDELRAGADEDGPWDAARGPRGSAIRWRGLLGLKKPHCTKQKLDSSEESAPKPSDAIVMINS